MAPLAWKQDKARSWDGGQTEPFPSHLHQGCAPVSLCIIHSRGFQLSYAKKILTKPQEPGMTAWSTCGVDVPLLLSLHAAVNWEHGRREHFTWQFAPAVCWPWIWPEFEGGHAERHLGDIWDQSRGI